MGWHERTVLVVVKAYPNPSTKHGETVCVAGVSDGTWIRLYPLPFRDLPPQLSFRKYDLIRLQVRKHHDPRPESYQVNVDTLLKLRHVGTEDGWSHRKRLLLPVASPSMCDIYRLQRETGKSLGMFKPREVSDLKMVREEDEWSSVERTMLQISLSGRALRPLERIPYSLKYVYRCDHPGCNGHEMKIVDWEAAQLYRKLRQRGDAIGVVAEKMKHKWLIEMFSPLRDSYLLVGNMKAYPHRFIVLGVFWPPTVRPARQGRLFES